MNLLAIDTSSKVSAIGLQVGKQRWYSINVSGHSHSRDILTNIAELVEEAGVSLGDLNAIAFGKGPGSFTGLRITVGVVQGLGFGLQIPVVPVSSLACLAQGEYRQSGATDILVVLSARKEEVYFGAYHIQDEIPVLVGEEGVLQASSIPALEPSDWVGVGDAWHLKQQLESAAGNRMKHVSVDVYPHPRDLLDIAGSYRSESIDAMQALPEYLREKVASKPGS